MPRAWFRNVNAIPGVAWSPLLPVETPSGHDAVARIERYESYLTPGTFDERLVWETPRGKPLRGSPAGRHGTSDDGQEVTRTPEEEARHISEVLSLPGDASDYHFAMLRAWDALWKVRSRELRAFDWIERLCLADIAMFEGLQGLAWTKADEDPDHRRLDTIPAGPAFTRLESMYVREGFLVEAADLERRLTALVGPLGRPNGLDDRQAAMRGGDVG